MDRPSIGLTGLPPAIQGMSGPLVRESRSYESITDPDTESISNGIGGS